MCHNLEPNSVDFDNMNLSLKENEKIDSIRANCTPGYERWCKSKINYYKVFVLLQRMNCIAKLNGVANNIKEKFSYEMKKIGIQFESEDYVGLDWIERDIKKQLFYFLNEKDFPEFYRYELANPLADNEKQQEIVDRAIGWIYWYNLKKVHPMRWEEDNKIQEILSGKEYKSSFKFPEDYPLREDQISSWGLALLGKRLRELAEIEIP